MLNNVLIIILSIICSLLAFAIVYGIVKKQISKYAMIIVIFIELCVITSIFFKSLKYFALLGVLGFVLPIFRKLKRKK